MSDSYPEYLNPFAEDLKPKSRLSISHSFKEFKKNLRKSFRIKKKEEEEHVIVRQKPAATAGNTLRRHPTSYPASYQLSAFPRSRFQQRVKCEPSTSTPGPNPFEEDSENEKIQKSSRKIKKKAPLPPKSQSSQDVNNSHLEVPSRGSRWSLTSADTNYSSSIQDDGGEIDGDDGEVKDCLVEKFIGFNEEMAKLQDDSNNNVITKEDINKSHESNNLSEEIAPYEDINKDTDDRRLSQTSEVENDNEELIINDISHNVINEENNKENGTEGSRDELNDSQTYVGRVSLYVTNNSDEIDNCNNSEVVYNDDKCDNDENDRETPVPKQRKNKLTKKTLLGV